MEMQITFFPGTHFLGVAALEMKGPRFLGGPTFLGVLQLVLLYFSLFTRVMVYMAIFVDANVPKFRALTSHAAHHCRKLL